MLAEEFQSSCGDGYLSLQSELDIAYGYYERGSFYTYFRDYNKRCGTNISPNNTPDGGRVA